MADEKTSGAWGSGVVVAAVAGVGALYVAWQNPALVSTRPTDVEYQGHEISAAQDIDARLWQDPFDAVARNVEAAGNRAPPPGNRFLADKPEAAGGDPPLTIAVTLPGAPYPEIAEARRRLRYAVVAALHVAGFLPLDEGHIGYLRTDQWPFPAEKPSPGLQVSVDEQHQPAGALGGSADLQSLDVAIHLARTSEAEPNPAARLPRTIPFEEFRRTPDVPGNSPERVLLLWLDENFLTSVGNPIASLRQLRQAFKRMNGKNFVVLGPQDSTTLAAMTHEIGDIKNQLRSLSIYNYSATAEEEDVMKAAGLPKHDSTDTLIKRFKNASLDYHRTVNFDNELAATLACELMRRDPNLLVGLGNGQQCDGLPSRKTPLNHIVLISDWDTVYGNYLTQTVKETFATQCKTQDKSKCAVCSTVEHFSYLRGLDGRLPNRRSEGQQKSSQSTASAQQTTGQIAETSPSVATPETASQFESAEGQSQFDYLRRLAAELKARNAGFRRDDGGHIAAIGVLGSDVYDKLLILQALRPEFPNVSFFTTDLDALLLPDKKSHYTRNLLVASSYGLKLDPRLQADIPPFRNTYQSSAFVTALHVIRKKLPNALPTKTPDQTCRVIKDTLALPLLFQIGRFGPQPLPTAPFEPPKAATDRCVETADPPGNPSPTLSRVQPAEIGLAPVSNSTLRGVFLIPLLLIGCLFFSPRVRRACFFTEIGRAGSWAWLWRGLGWTVTALVSLAVLAGWACLTFGWAWVAPWLTEGGLGEPISVLDGITVWPTVALRSFGILLALFLIWYTVHELEANRRETLKRFNELHPYELLKTWTRLRETGKSVVAVLWAFLWFPRLKDAAIDQRDDDPREEKPFGDIIPAPSGYWAFRCFRALIGTLMIFPFYGLILNPVFGDVVLNPARGEHAQSIYIWVSTFDVLSTFFLTVLIIDATIYSQFFMKRLTSISTKWDDFAITKYVIRYHLTDINDLRDWADLQFLAQRTVSISNLVYFPFIAWAVLIFSRSRLFDDFYMPWSLMAMYALPLCVLTGAVVAYRLTAEKARHVACTHITNRITAAKGNGREATAGQLERLLADMQELHEGAFAPWTSQPIVKAVLLPLLTYGGAWLLHLYALPGA